MRYAIWTAVSTVKQTVGDKASLAEQEAKCRAVGDVRGWTETAGPFIVPGKSRTRWVNLRDAEMEIPALHEMLEAARTRRFDVLALYDYNRLRDLLDPVAKTLASYGIQIYSVNQPVEPLLPDEFNPYSNDSEQIMRGMSQIISRWQIADLRRKYRYGITARVQNGKYGINIPYGYARGAGDIPIVVPSQAAAVIAMKDLFLQGVSTRNIIKYLNEHFPTARGAKSWARETIVGMLMNKFYAGKVFFGETKTIRDPHNNTKRVIKNPDPVIADGLHKPLYSWDEYQAILVEFERRANLPNSRVYPFSGLLVCSICGHKLYHFITRDVWRCAYTRNGGGHTDHIKLPHRKALEIVPPALLKAVKTSGLSVQQPMFQSAIDNSTAIADLERQRKRIQDGFEMGIYSAIEAEEKIKDLDRRIAGLKNQTEQNERQQARNRLREQNLQDALKRKNFADWIVKDDPKIVNSFLLFLFHQIVISPDHQVVEVKLRLD
jgi:DNA invertase Pin-like site-specific DNA recombinase